ncbi:MAG: PfkB family carbohydrate kinase [Candidatus Paceibacterota bacterium]
MKKFDAVIGVSVNPEMELVIENTPGPKKVLKCMTCCLSGSSGNTATAIKCLGGCPHLLGLVSAYEKEDVADVLLRSAVLKGKVPFTAIPILSETNHAIIPVIGESNDEVWGKKGDIVHSELPQALRILAGPEIGIGPQTFVVITGLRAVEILFAKALLSQAKVKKGFRVLNAKDTLCANKEFKKILPLVDLLVLNKREFEETGMGFSQIHKCGPKIVVVTHDKEGGIFSFSNYRISFKPVSFSGGRFETGAGDWFLGAMISELVRLRESVLTIQLKQFMGVINFAARVAGKKITMAGGGNGPSRHQLR